MKDHLAKAKDYIAKGEDFYRKAADEIVAAMEQDSTLSYREIGKRLGRNESWARRLVKWSTSAAGPTTPFGGEDSIRRAQGHAKEVLRKADTNTIRSIVKDLPPKQVERVIQEANEVAVGHARARQSEHRDKAAIGELMGDDPFKPDEFWLDGDIIRANQVARTIASKMQRGGGLILGAMEIGRALERLEETERLISEARAAAQERIRDETVGVS